VSKHNVRLDIFLKVTTVIPALVEPILRQEPVVSLVWLVLMRIVGHQVAPLVQRDIILPPVRPFVHLV
jgi:hypothetical protein